MSAALAGRRVAVDHSLFVGVLQAQRRLPRELASVANRHRAGLLHLPSDADPVHIFHHEDMQVARLVGVVRGDDVGMREPRGGFHFETKSFQRRLVSDQPPIDHLECDRPLHVAMLGLVHDSHAAGADPLDDAVPWMVAEFVGQRVRRGTGARRRSRGSARVGGSQVSQQRVVGNQAERVAARVASFDMRFDFPLPRLVQASLAEEPEFIERRVKGGGRGHKGQSSSIKSFAS